VETEPKTRAVAEQLLSSMVLDALKLIVSIRQKSSFERRVGESRIGCFAPLTGVIIVSLALYQFKRLLKDAELPGCASTT